MQCGVDVFQHNGVIAAVYSGGKTVADFMRNNESGLSTAAKKLFTKLNIQYTTISQIVVMIFRLKTDLSLETIHFGAFLKLLDIVAANSESLLFFE